MDEVFKIERPGEGSPVVDNPMRSESGPALPWLPRRAWAGLLSPPCVAGPARADPGLPRPGKSGPSCKHCKDDESKTCRVCACHLCGGKQDPDKQLLCDECDMAFHIYCLCPPLSSIPKEDEW